MLLSDLIFLACFAPLFRLGIIFGALITHKIVDSALAKRPTPMRTTVL